MALKHFLLFLFFFFCECLGYRFLFSTFPLLQFEYFVRVSVCVFFSCLACFVGGIGNLEMFSISLISIAGIAFCPYISITIK